MFDEILEDVRKVADRLEEEIEEYVFDDNKLVSSFSESFFLYLLSCLLRVCVVEFVCVCVWVQTERVDDTGFFCIIDGGRFGFVDVFQLFLICFLSFCQFVSGLFVFSLFLGGLGFWFLECILDSQVFVSIFQGRSEVLGEMVFVFGVEFRQFSCYNVFGVCRKDDMNFEN